MMNSTKSGKLKALGFVALLAALVIALAAPFALAESYLDFGIPSGSLSYSNDTLSGFLDVTSVTGVGTPINSGVSLAITDGYFFFQTGSLISTTGNTWRFGSGGADSIVMYGGITGNSGLGIVALPYGPLLAGSLLDAVVTANEDTFTLTASLFDFKNDFLLQDFDLPTGIPYVGTLTLSFSATFADDGSFTSTSILQGGHITNTPVPEPATFMLFCSGLIGIAAFRKKLVQG